MKKLTPPQTRIHFLLFSAFFFQTAFLFSQTQIPAVPPFTKPVVFLPCGTQDTNVEAAAALSKMVQEMAAQNRLVPRAGTTYIAVRPQIIQKDDGTGGLSLNDLHYGLADINRQYAPISVQFYICETTPNYINSSAYYNDATDVAGARAIYNVNNAYNLYFTGSIANASGFSYITPSTRANNASFIVNSYVLGDKTFPHEVGHYFGLSHTFNNSASAVITDRELVTRVQTNGKLPPNCDTKGDYICDTPADPYDLPGGNSSSNCVYTGTVTDANGDAFSPSITNYMNYYFCQPYDFTPGQYARMSAGVQFNTTRTDPNTGYSLDCPETAQPAPANVTAMNISPTVNQGVNITWTSASAVASGYFIERATSAGGNFIPIGGVGPSVFSFVDISASNNGTYYYRVKPSNTKATYSPVVSVQTAPVCSANYTTACTAGGFYGSAIVNDFILQNAAGTATLISNTGSGCSPNSYGNFTNLSANVRAGSTYNFTMRTLLLNGSYYRQQIGIFIDLNHNGNFSDPGEQVYQSPLNAMNGTIEIDGSFTIPATATLGSTYLRIRTQYNNGTQVSTACGTFDNGETEDYQLNISAALPVTLTSFNGKNTPAGNLLSWKTESEYQSDHFDVERSRNGQAFETVGQTPALGKAADYSFLDNRSLPAIGYYRLKMIDLDGSYKYSSAVAIEMPGAKNQYMLFPNPVGGSLHILAHYDEPGTAEFVLYNLLGQKVYSTAQAVGKGLNETTLDVSRLPGGVYIGEIQRGTGEAVKIGRIIKY